MHFAAITFWFAAAFAPLYTAGPPSGHFDGADTDMDGIIEPDEIQRLAQQLGLGGDRGGSNMRADRDGDGDVSVAELREWEARIETHWSVNEVADWITLALRLPQYAAAFRLNSISGDDLRDLLSDPDGEQILIEELKIESKRHRKKIKRAIKRLLYSIGSVPGTPTPVSCASLPAVCGAVDAVWSEPPLAAGRRAHAYRLEWTCAPPLGQSGGFFSHGIVRSDTAARADEERLSWSSAPPDIVKECTTCEHRFALDASRGSAAAPPPTGAEILVRVQAWNDFGHGDFSRGVRCAAPVACALPAGGMSAEQRMQGLGDADGDGMLHAEELRDYTRGLLSGDTPSSIAGDLSLNDPDQRARAEGRRASEAAHLARLDTNR